MNRIRPLPTLLINQIAAGECIERPSSVVKELVENSLDAGARSIDIFIEEAGSRLIKIVDDGGGIALEDLPFALQSHATSKLETVDDLSRISTLGFRGEALASIASISELELSSRLKENIEGYMICARNGEVEPVKPVGMSPGTSVVVRDLFFNIPARRKFLKKKSTEIGHIKDLVVRLALVAYETSFKLIHNEKLILAVEGKENRSERVRDLLEIEDASLIEVSETQEKSRIEAYLVPPEINRPNSKLQFVYVNKRSVRDKVILRAFVDGYKDYLPPKRQPVGVILLEIDPDEVDVNVHPTKAEVRYQDSSYVYRRVYHTVMQGLSSHNLTPSLPLSSSINQKKSPSEENLLEQESYLQPRATGDLNSLKNSSEKQSQASDFSDLEPQPKYKGYTSPLPQGESVLGKDLKDFPVPSTFSEIPPRESFSSSQEKIPPYQSSSRGKQESFESEAPRNFQIHDSYLVVETSEGIEIIDQHALHERIIYSRLRKQMKSAQVISQMLLFPATVKLTGKEMSTFLEWKDKLDLLGIEAETFGPSEVIIRSLPQLLGNVAEAGLLHDILEQIDKSHRISLDEIYDSIIETMSCKAAVKAGDELNPEEIESLIRRKEGADNPFHCPHGRPTTLKITLRELEKHFKRR